MSSEILKIFNLSEVSMANLVMWNVMKHSTCKTCHKPSFEHIYFPKMVKTSSNNFM